MAKIDVPHFLSENGHTLLDQRAQDKAGPGGLDVLIFEVEKA
jgi:TusA-related sulfurtransferase